MKLIKGSNSIDLTEEVEQKSISGTSKKKTLKKDSVKEKKNDPKVYKEIAQEFGERIKVMKDINKGQASSQIRFSVFDKTNQQAKQMTSKCNNLFSTVGHVHRAAHYLGLHVLWHLTMEKTASYEDKILHDTIMILEKANYQKQTIDQFMLAFGEGLKGIMGTEDELELMKNCELSLKKMPKNMEKRARKKMKEVMEGQKTVYQTLYKKVQGQHLKAVV